LKDHGLQRFISVTVYHFVRSTARFFQSGQYSKKRGFAAPTRTEQADEFSIFHFKINISDGVDTAIFPEKYF
jgi:hypothetical protein